MLDIKIVRQDPEMVKQAVKNRNGNLDAEIDELLEIDQTRREIILAVEELKAKQNSVSKMIPQYKKEGKDVTAIFAEMKELSETIKEQDAKLSELDAKQRTLLLCIPNIPSATVPVGTDDSCNPEIRRNGTPKEFDFEPKAHWDIGGALGILDPETAAKVTGTRFHFYKGLGARLERAIISYFLDTHTEYGYTEVLPPFMANRASMTATGQLPKFEEDAFKLSNNEFFLIHTA